jgi:HlyD family secretion protein
VTIPIQALTVRTRRQLEEEEQSSKGGKGKVQAATTPTTTAAKEKEKEEVQGIFLLKDGRALFTPVETGVMGQSDVEVVKGVQANDQIVSGPFSVLRTLKNHTKVKVDNSALTPAGSTS